MKGVEHTVGGDKDRYLTLFKHFVHIVQLFVGSGHGHKPVFQQQCLLLVGEAELAEVGDIGEVRLDSVGRNLGHDVNRIRMVGAELGFDIGSDIGDHLRRNRC